MTPTEYLKESARTDGQTQRDNFVEQILDYPDHLGDLIHASMGVSTEAGEILDTLKKTLFYGKPLDKVNIREEIGDVLWYVAKLCRDLDLTLEECMDLNIAKLKARYPGAYSDEAANNRDLVRERGILEQDMGVPAVGKKNLN